MKLWVSRDDNAALSFEDETWIWLDRPVFEESTGEWISSNNGSDGRGKMIDNDIFNLRSGELVELGEFKISRAKR